jgi:ATP-dependent helicase/nuclease subunit A
MSMENRRRDHPSAFEDPSVRQRRAANPETSVWVGASAGTGKTKVLTDRVLRLMLPRDSGAPGTDPHRILCLTYTKAAASEMALRINKILSAWATIDDERLDRALMDLLGRRAELPETDAARRLFARVVDAPGGLKIMTIHSFCQSVLGRFPLEAGLPPRFRAMEEDEASALLTLARDRVLARAQSRPNSDEGRALEQLAAEQNEDQFNALLRALTSERHQLQHHLDKLETMDGFYTGLCQTLAVDPAHTPDELGHSACGDAAFAATELWQACRHLASGSKTDRERSLAMQLWLEYEQGVRASSFPQWSNLFLTREGEPRKALMTKALIDAQPHLGRAMREEAERLLALAEQVNACRLAGLTRDLVILGRAITHEYQALKDRRAALDFDDLIHRTLDLLNRDMAAWVMYKLDGGIDHMLIDEAQDTNPEQWRIAERLTQEFFAGEGARNRIRTLFVVGDVKQSIYSFQRADPRKFLTMQQEFRAKIEQSGLSWDEVPLNTSFRSTSSVLRLVDRVFHPEEAKKGLGPDPVHHESWRTGQAGHVELWPLFKVAPPEKTDLWTPALDIRTSRKASALLADHIASTITGWLENGEILPSRDRPVQPGDILVLVRRRSGFVTALIRALKHKAIPVSGIDRMVLNDQMAVQDLLAVAQAALLPEDDLTLACVLKSPFVGWDDARLEAVALGRQKGESLWDAVRDRDADTARWLSVQISQASSAHPYEFFSSLLQGPCPADPVSGLHAISARLGDEALDPLTEFLNQALAFEADHIAALQLFLKWQTEGEKQIKREQEEAGGKVRIMTVHASKGLQAPIVFLPDTLRSAQSAGGSARRLLWPDKTALNVPLWSPRKGIESQTYRDALARVEEREDEEYRRLLYVAMTRAEDRLYVCGAQGRNAPRPGSWYDLIAAAFQQDNDAERFPFLGPEGLEAEGPFEALRLSNRQTSAPEAAKHVQASPLPLDLSSTSYHWVYAQPGEEPHPPRPLTPSRPSGLEPAARSPLQTTDAYRFRRGLVTHRLLQILPDLPDQTRQTAAERFAAQAVHGLPEDVQADIVRETLAILRDPAYAALFGPLSLAEVPITGFVGGRLVSGQIDRLLIEGTAISIVDYKTNRPPPASEADVPDPYRRQLRAYADTLAEIYPGRAIHTFLLWTDGARLMEIKI